MTIMDMLPLWGVYLLTVILLLIAAEIGFRLGILMRKRDPSFGEGSMRGVVVGGLLGLMAFLLAFTIGIVIDQHGGRKAMVVAETNSIGTAWLRAGFLDELEEVESRELLREYVEVRLAGAADPTTLPAMVARSEEIHNDLWIIVEDVVNRGNDSDIMALYVESINEVIDVHLLRITAATLRLPPILGRMLFVAAFLSFLLVGLASSSDGKRDVLAIVLFALAFVAVLMIIVDLDRPQQGLLTVSQQAMEGLLKQTSAPSQ